MLYPHRLDHYSVTYSQDSSAGMVRSIYLQSGDVPCFHQPALSVNTRNQSKTDLEQELGKVYLTDGAIWEGIAIDHIVEISGVRYAVKGKKNLCGAGTVFRLDVSEDVTGEI